MSDKKPAAYAKYILLGLILAGIVLWVCLSSKEVVVEAPPVVVAPVVEAPPAAPAVVAPAPEVVPAPAPPSAG